MKTVLVVLVVVLLFCIAYVRYLESISVFHPSFELTSTPERLDMTFEDVYFRSSDGFLINGWFIKNSRAHSTMLYFHGNAGNIADRLDKIRLFDDMGMNVFIIDYRGYGKSKGKPSEHGIFEDAVSAYDYLLTRNDVVNDRIGAYGASLGGAVAVDLATKRSLACLIVDSSFSSAADMGKTLYPYLPICFMQTKLDSLSKIKKVSVPKLFIHSPQDDLIPIRLGRKLFDAALPPKKFIETSGTHNDSYVVSQDIWMKEIRDFLKSLNFI